MGCASSKGNSAPSDGDSAVVGGNTVDAGDHVATTTASQPVADGSDADYVMVPRRVVVEPTPPITATAAAAGATAIAGDAAKRTPPSSTSPTPSAVWIADDAMDACFGCQAKFTFILRKHHCRQCGLIFCAKCAHHGTSNATATPVRLCDPCRKLTLPDAKASAAAGGGAGITASTSSSASNSTKTTPAPSPPLATADSKKVPLNVATIASGDSLSDVMCDRLIRGLQLSFSAHCGGSAVEDDYVAARCPGKKLGTCACATKQLTDANYVNGTPLTLKETTASSTDTESTFQIAAESPVVFCQIRHHFGVSVHEFCDALTGSGGSGGNNGAKSGTTQRTSPLAGSPSQGKGGAYFYFSRCRKFVFKTLTSKEAALMRTILPAYRQFIADYPHTLLPRYFGLYRIVVDTHVVDSSSSPSSSPPTSMPNTKRGSGNGPSLTRLLKGTPGTDDVSSNVNTNANVKTKRETFYFVCMSNVFDTVLDIHEQFDLKGSTVNRRATLAELKHASPVLKDVDFAVRERRIMLGAERKMQLTLQLRADVGFLEEHRIMDYSLLVGIHHNDATRRHQLKTYGNNAPDTDAAAKASAPSMTKATVKQQLAAKKADRKQSQQGTKIGFGALNTKGDSKDKTYKVNAFHDSCGGMLGDDGSYYFLGLIDALQLYNAKKRIEKGLKLLKHGGGAAVSSQPPDMYGKRFLKYVASIVD